MMRHKYGSHGWLRVRRSEIHQAVMARTRQEIERQTGWSMDSARITFRATCVRRIDRRPRRRGGASHPWMRSRMLQRE